MIATLRGTVLAKETERVVVEAGGVGYEVSVTAATLGHISAPGHETFLHIVESFGMYGGGQTLYGFLTPSEKSMFCTFRDEVPSTGAKKALEYLDKASKSLPDFRRAIIERDAKLLTGVFGFSKKTAERLIDSLKDKIEGVHVPGVERIARPSAPDVGTGTLAQALAALAALGYKPSEARTAILQIAEETGGKELATEQVVRMALKRL
jgi:Holliday junction DNA helicase RuvA